MAENKNYRAQPVICADYGQIQISRKEIDLKKPQIIHVLGLESIFFSIGAVELQHLEFSEFLGVALIPLVQWATKFLEISSPAVWKYQAWNMPQGACRPSEMFKSQGDLWNNLFIDNFFFFWWIVVYATNIQEQHIRHHGLLRHVLPIFLYSVMKWMFTELVFSYISVTGCCWNQWFIRICGFIPSVWCDASGSISLSFISYLIR